MGARVYTASNECKVRSLAGYNAARAFCLTKPTWIKHMKTFSAKPAEVEKKWILIDAEGMVVGRLAAYIANHLRGKHLPTFTPHVDCGDNVIVINADKVMFTGRKYENKKYYWHTGSSRRNQGKNRTARGILEGKFPGACGPEGHVQRMMPGGPLSNKQLKNLRSLRRVRAIHMRHNRS